MSDLIDREYAIKRFCEDGTYLERHGVGMMTLCEAKQRAVDLIESFPSAQPKRGKWILDRSGAYCCSKCMEPCAGYVMMKPRDKFCKMCGSRNEVTT